MRGAGSRFFAAVVLLLVAAHAGAEPATPNTLVSGVLRVGTYFVNPPFEFPWTAEGSGLRSI
jgi:hypothetical protein